MQFVFIMILSLYLIIIGYNMKIPEHLAIIMDGNRRWPKKINKANVTEGHRVGADRLEEIVENVEIWG